MTVRKERKPRWGTPRLELSSGLRFALRLEVRLSVTRAPSVEDTARDVLKEAGFEPVRWAAPTGKTNEALLLDAGAWVGERGLRRKGGTAATAEVPIITLFAAGCILGWLDAYLVGSWLVGGLWVLGSAVAAALFWLRFGRTYDSYLAMVTVVRPPVVAASAPGSVSVVFWAARVRSQIHSGVRVPIGVGAPMGLAREVGELAREFQRRVSGPPGREPSGTVPS